jgi:sulfur-carrier protein
MPRVHLPALFRPLAEDTPAVDVDGLTLRAVIDALEQEFPGIAQRVVDAGAIRPEIVIAINGVETRELDATVERDSDVYILSAIAGGDATIQCASD